MKRTTWVKGVVGAVVLAAARGAVAAEGTALGGGMGLLTIAFLVVAAVIVVGQVIPAALMFGAMVKGLFAARGEREPAEKVNDLG